MACPFCSLLFAEGGIKKHKAICSANPNPDPVAKAAQEKKEVEKKEKKEATARAKAEGEAGWRLAEEQSDMVVSLLNLIQFGDWRPADIKSSLQVASPCRPNPHTVWSQGNPPNLPADAQ